jgi:hypothetical protein
MILRRHGYDPDVEIVSLLHCQGVVDGNGQPDGYQVEYVINAPVSVVGVVESIYTENGNLIIFTSENW